MAEIRVIFGDDDRENEEFLGFDLDNIEEAEKRYILQLYMLNDFDSNIEFSEMGSPDKGNCQQYCRVLKMCQRLCRLLSRPRH
jgi:hypothetical protein